jgi:hypothetical protein
MCHLKQLRFCCRCVQSLFRSFVRSCGWQQVLNLTSTKARSGGEDAVFAVEDSQPASSKAAHMDSNDDDDDDDEDTGSELDFGSDDDDDEEDGGEEDDDDETTISEEFRAKVLKALGRAALTEVDDDEGEASAASGDASMESMTEEEMAEVDRALGAVFREQASMRKQGMAALNQAKLHFKMRVADLVDTYLKKTQGGVHVLRMIDPLVNAERAANAVMGADARAVHDRLQGLIRSRLVKCDPPTDKAKAAVEDEDHPLEEVLDSLFGRARSAPNEVSSALFASCIMLVVRVVVRAHPGALATLLTKPAAATPSKGKRAAAGAAAVPAVVQLLATRLTEALKDYLERKTCHFGVSTFRELVTRYPLLGLSLGETLVRGMVSAVHPFRAMESGQLACLLLKQCVHGSPALQAAGGTLLGRYLQAVPELLSQLDKDTSAAPADARKPKAKHVRAVLQDAMQLLRSLSSQGSANNSAAAVMRSAAGIGDAATQLSAALGAFVAASKASDRLCNQPLTVSAERLADACGLFLAAGVSGSSSASKSGGPIVGKGAAAAHAGAKRVSAEETAEGESHGKRARTGGRGGNK